MPVAMLYTRDDRFVATVPVPAFTTPPEALLWSSRTFFLREYNLHSGTDHEYVEGYCYVVTAPAIAGPGQ